MCGIVGFTGNRQAAPILLDGLSKLEYRGYDSAGLAVRDGENLAQVVKAKGRLSNLMEKTDNGNALKGTCGIGHTRWATHGEPSQTNAHPHVSGNCTRSGSGAVESEVVGVHNGIIENYTELKEKLLKHGYTFYSQTDTEVVIKLVDYYYKKYGLGPIDAIAKTMVRVRGSYALELMFRDYPGEIWVARKDSPMIIGIADGETYMIVNQEYVFIGFSDDMSSPCNFSWGMVIKGKEIAQRLQSHFNIYWSSQFSLLIKDKDEVKQRNLKKIERYVYDIDHNMNLIKYQGLTLEICHVNEKNRSVVPLLENLNGFYRNCCCDILQNEIERKIDETSEFVKKRTQEYIRFDRDKATELIAKMMMDSKKKICAVSLDIDDNDFWINSEGEEVFRANIDAIKKQKVMIERVFVCTKAKREILKEAIDEQCKAGIGVTYTEYKKGMGGTYEDFMIVDNQALLIFEKNCVRVSMNRAHIEQYNKKYLKIKNMGTVL